MYDAAENTGTEGEERGAAIYEKTPCEVCGKLVSTYHMARKRHMKTHEPKEVQSVSKPRQAAVSAPQLSPATVEEINETVKSIPDEKTRERMRTALMRQKVFEEAPQLFASESGSDEFMEYRRAYLPESIPEYDPATGKVVRPPTKHEYFGDKSTIDQDVQRGYVPVLNAQGEHIATPSGMYMYWMPQKLHESRKAHASRESNALLQTPAKNMQPQGNDRSFDGTDAGDVIVEEESVTREEI